MKSRPARAFHPGKGSGQKQTEYRIGDPVTGNSDSRTKRVKSLMQTGAEAFRIFASSFVRSLPAPPVKRVVVRQAGKASAKSVSLPNQKRGRQDWSRIVALSDRRQVWLPKPSAPGRLPAPIRDEGEGSGDKQGRNRRRAKSRDPSRERQCQFGAPGGPGKVMVAKGLSPADGSASATPGRTGV